jgi:hypothetical protein
VGVFLKSETLGCNARARNMENIYNLQTKNKKQKTKNKKQKTKNKKQKTKNKKQKKTKKQKQVLKIL